MNDSHTEEPAGDQNQPEVKKTLSDRSARVSFVALVLAIGAVALSTWAAFRPVTPEAATEIDAAADDAARIAAEQKLCIAFETVHRGVSLNTNASAPGGPADVAGGMAVAANARLALFGGGEYLLSRIDPAVSTELEEASRSFADMLVDIGAISISGVPTSDPAQADRLQAAEELSGAVDSLCAGT